MDPTTQSEKVIAMMIRRNDEKKWWYAWEYIGQVEGLFVGHRAPARISELAINYPEMIESKKEGKFKIFRFRFENYLVFKETITSEMRSVVIRELIKVGRMHASDSFVDLSTPQEDTSVV